MVTDKQVHKAVEANWKACMKEYRSGTSTRECRAGTCIHHGCVKARLEREESQNLIEPGIGRSH